RAHSERDRGRAGRRRRARRVPRARARPRQDGRRCLPRGLAGHGAARADPRADRHRVAHRGCLSAGRHHLLCFAARRPGASLSLGRARLGSDDRGARPVPVRAPPQRPRRRARPPPSSRRGPPPPTSPRGPTTAGPHHPSRPPLSPPPRRAPPPPPRGPRHPRGAGPPPPALVVFLSALALRRVGFGLLLIVAFSVGLALVLVAIGMVMVYARRLVARFDESGPLVTRWLPLTSSAVMTLLGASIAVQA